MGLLDRRCHRGQGENQGHDNDGEGLDCQAFHGNGMG